MAIIGISGKIGTGKDLTASIIQFWLWKAKVESAKDMSIHYTFKDFIDNPTIGESLSHWKIVKFADKLKDIVCILLGCTREQLEDREFKETELGEEWWYYRVFTVGSTKPGKQRSRFVLYSYLENKDEWHPSTLIKPTPRLLMQLLGTECGRQILHPNCWVNATMSGYIKRPISIHCDAYPNWIITDVRFPNEAKAVKDKGGIMIRINRNDYIFDDNGKRIIPTKEYTNITNQQHESETALDDYIFDYVIDNDSTIEELAVKVKEILLKEKML